MVGAHYWLISANCYPQFIRALCSKGASMKSGDILVSSASTWTSWGIRLATGSRYSHVAIAISDSEVFEATPDGVLPVSLDSFISSNTRVLLLSRPLDLTADQLSKVKEAVHSKKYLSYNLFRTLNSGFSQFGFNLGFLTLLIFSCLFAVIGNWLYLVFFTAVMLVPMTMLYVSANPVKSNELFIKLRVPKKLLTDLDSHFCSQLVLDIDNDIVGGLSENWKRPNEPRPKDIKRLALKSGFRPVKIKPNTFESSQVNTPK